MIDPGRAFTEESEIGLELHEKPLNHSLIEFQSESIFGKNSSEVIADNISKHSALVSTSLYLISHWPIPVREDSPLDVLLTFFPVTV